ncbi:hypothetical protein QJS04_geneDACA017125 [Acorus gramineus]|uniref:Uncharacterized protein n=1 Tax=Acorus gramineus TaxID=55184 RepID=A0AAV9AX90_ACOGR|nr:hypothetical protein QJS04_geneDACA017125 [Acorus gramineus]
MSEMSTSIPLACGPRNVHRGIATWPSERPGTAGYSQVPLTGPYVLMRAGEVILNPHCKVYGHPTPRIQIQEVIYKQ